jgi:hypothetical protein
MKPKGGNNSNGNANPNDRRWRYGDPNNPDNRFTLA